MRPTAVLASALVRPAAVLTAAVPGGYGGGGGNSGGDGGDGGGGGGGGKCGVDGGGEGVLMQSIGAVPRMYTSAPSWCGSTALA